MEAMDPKKEILVVASGNRNKLIEIESLLGDRYEIRPMADYGILDIEENGSSFEENAAIKARFVMEKTGLASLADDSGLEVDALQGTPGIYSARYCGRHGDDAANNALLLQNLSGMKKPWTARYVAAIALARPGKEMLVRRGTCEGEGRLGNGAGSTAAQRSLRRRGGGDAPVVQRSGRRAGDRAGNSTGAVHDRPGLHQPP